jgi:protein-disulfide isomerase
MAPCVHPSRLFLSALLLMLVTTLVVAQGVRPVPPSALAAILADPLATPPAGNARGDVTVVEYFDYNCPVCRHIEPELRQLLASDPKVRLVHKDWPVFGDASVYAAYCSFAAAREGKYQIAHDALITSRMDLDSKEDVRAVLRAAGVDLKKIDADVALHEKEYSEVLARNKRETAVLGLRGTPGLIIGNHLVLGSIDYLQLKQMIAEARRSGGPL